MNRCFLTVLVLGLGLTIASFAAGQSTSAQTGETPPTQPAHDSTSTYLLGPSDVVHIEALNHADFNVRVPIGADGTIQLPYVGTTTAANMTISALRDRVAKELTQKGVFTNLSLEADVVSYGSRYATVLGGVVTPGMITLDRQYHLSQVLARAGGIRAGSSDFVILRSVGGGERQLAIQDIATGDDSSDPVINPGDKLYVPTEVFYIKGQVKTPGAYPLSMNMTLAMALARGGGLTDLGSDSHIMVIRKNTQLQPADLNFKVMSDDVIDVGEGWF